ncbi:hypothetical protein DdX_07529 [Ditylenchus destructor]|uniref:Uncharacterized protein n=1 Tax=Ditylenchus destructor TaxID=166010 RepID=A0AAD4N6L1_9BILA|nr:hypothetical protein DdX_07529 [Ditylenchus destructor]
MECSDTTRAEYFIKRHNHYDANITNGNIREFELNKIGAYRQGNQVTEVPELDDNDVGLHKDKPNVENGIYNVASIRNDKNAPPTYRDVDDENSPYGPLATKPRALNHMGDGPPVSILFFPQLTQATEYPKLMHAPNGYNNGSVEKNEKMDKRSSRKKKIRDKENKGEKIEPEKLPGFFGNLNIDDIYTRIEGVQPASTQKPKRQSKKKNSQRKSNESKLAASDEVEEMDVDIVLDVSGPEEPACSVSILKGAKENMLKINNPFLNRGMIQSETDDSKRNTWASIVDAILPEDKQNILTKKNQVKSKHQSLEMDDLIFLEGLWNAFVSNGSKPVHYASKK